MDQQLTTTEQELKVFDAAREQIEKLAANCRDVVVVDADSLVIATNFAVTGRKIKKLIEDKRKEITKPLLDRKRHIDGFVKTLLSELDTNVASLRDKILKYEREQERIRMEVARLAEEERLRKEAEMRQKVETALQEEEISDDVLADLTKSKDELIQAKTVEADIQVQKSSNLRKVWNFKVVDIKQVPVEFLFVDGVAVRKAIKSGIRDIAGIDIFQEEQLNLR